MEINREGIAIITGGDGDMGREIVAACATSGYRTIMTTRLMKQGTAVRDELIAKYPGVEIEVEDLELTSRQSILNFAERIRQRGDRIAILANNAGVLCKKFERTPDNIEQSVAVNYVGPYLLTRLLLPMMTRGSRIVNTVSITYKIGKIKENFFTGKDGTNRFTRYANSKLALLLFTLELSSRVIDRGILVNAADPGIVSTKMIRLDKWFDPITDLIYRPLIKNSTQGSSTAIKLALSEEIDGVTGRCYANRKQKRLPDSMYNHPCRRTLWSRTEEMLCSNPEVKNALIETERLLEEVE